MSTVWTGRCVCQFLLPGVLFFLKIMSIFRILFLHLGMFLDFLLWYNIKDVLFLKIDVF